MQTERDLLIHLLEILEEAVGCSFIWKITSALNVEFNLPEKHRVHLQPFCVCVKAICPEYETSCMRNDMEQISRRALEQRTAFVNICHAGVGELVVPIFHGDHFLGVILGGPFLTADSKCVYPETSGEFHRLQKLSETRAAALADIVARVMHDAHPAMREEGENEREMPVPEQIDDIRIRDTMTFIQQKFRRTIPVSETARRCSLSKSRFLHLFKEKTGLSYSEYLNRLRIGEASRLLIGTDLRMNEIATACGISDQSRLAALFKRYHHSSPTSYRKHNRKSQTVLKSKV